MSTAERRTRERKIKQQRALHRRAMEIRAVAEAASHERQVHEDWLLFLTARGVLSDTIALRVHASHGDLDAMRELANRHDPVYRDAFRSACIDVLGEDPDEDWQ